MNKNRHDFLKNLRREKDYSQEYIASILGISQKAYSEIENGKTALKHDLVEKLAAILHVSADKTCEVSNCCAREERDKKEKLLALLKTLNVPIPKDLI